MKVFSFAILMALLTLSWLDFHSDQTEQQSATDKITQSYFDDFRLFQKAVSELVVKTQNQADLPALRQQITETRTAYKKIEFLFDYLQTDYNYLFINGPPLPKFNEEIPDIIVEPNGLQALDELIFSEDAEEKIGAIEQLSGELKKSVDNMAESHFQTRLTDRQVIEALRSGTVRVFALGLTGFDSPGSGNALAEALVSMQSMEKTFLFFGENVKPEAREKFQEIEKLYREAQEFLESNTDFDSFDRMAFLKQITNPLYEKLLDFQMLNGIPAEQFKNHAQDYASRNVFDEDFLNTDYFSEFSFLPLDNPASIKLGKTLFYDPILSKKRNMSCASCHDPMKGFTDGLPKSKTNVEGSFTRRNAPTLIDAGYSSRYFWDMREYNLERQVAHVVNDSLEFNMGFGEIADRLSQSAAYVQMFEAVYQQSAKNVIYRRTISNAIAAYVNSLKSFDSEFDQYVRDEISEYSQEAINGFNLFMGKAACGTCHFAPVFNGAVPPFYIETESEVLGVTLDFDTLNPQKDLDPGRIRNGLKREERLHFENSFKTVTVRNSALTAPYMHNGLFDTLEDVLEFYNLGGGAGMGLEIANQTLSETPLNLSEKEKSDIITFLHTLTDTTGLTSKIITLPKFENRPEWNDRGY